MLGRRGRLSWVRQVGEVVWLERRRRRDILERRGSIATGFLGERVDVVVLLVEDGCHGGEIEPGGAFGGE